jgi:uncharacterized protein (DUF302 family)
MVHRIFLALSISILCANALAQQPATPAKPTEEQVKQMQAMMQRQMQMMAVMFDVRPSKLAYDETVNAVKSGAGKRGWKVGDVQDMQAQMQQAGMKDAKRMTVIPTCPAGANDKITKASGGKAPALPCRATVFEGKDGKTYLVRMNTANMAKLMQDAAVAKAMAEVGAEEESLYKDIVQ